MPDTVEGERYKVLDAISHISSEGSRTANHVEAADHPASLEESSREIVHRQSVAQAVPGRPDGLVLKLGQIDDGVLQTNKDLQGGVDTDLQVYLLDGDFVEEYELAGALSSVDHSLG